MPACVKCQVQLSSDEKFCTACGTPVWSPGGTLKEYKVLTQKDRWFAGKFDPEKVEAAINAYAGEGWVFKGVATASIPHLTGTRDEMIIIMERDK